MLLREGFEAILLIAALMTFLTKAGATQRRGEVAAGAWAAVGASILTAVAFELLLTTTPGQREALEGFTMLVATARWIGTPRTSTRIGIRKTPPPVPRIAPSTPVATPEAISNATVQAVS